MGDETSLSPVVQRRRLRTKLRAARQAAGLTQEQAAKAVEWSLSKIIRIEAGTVRLTTVDLKALLGLYGIDDAESVDEFVALARAAREQGWWNSYSEFLATADQRELGQLIGYEGAASIIRNFETLLVPGLLQTEEYARAVARQFADIPSEEDRAQRERQERADKMVEIRMERQAHLLDLTEPPLMFFVLDEAVVRREVGGRATMARQINWLLELANRPYVTIEVVRFSAGAYPGLRGPFVVLEFPDAADDDVLYLESPREDLIRREEPEQVLPYRETFEQLRESSLGPDKTKSFLADIAKKMT